MPIAPPLTITTPVGTQAAPFQVLTHTLPEAIRILETATSPEQMRPLIPGVLDCLSDLRGLSRDVSDVTSRLVEEGKNDGYLDATLRDFQQVLAVSGLRERLGNPAVVAAEFAGLDTDDMVARAGRLGEAVNGALGERSPTFWRKIKHPIHKGRVVCSVSPGKTATCQGDARALHYFLTLGPKHPRTVAAQAECLRYVSYRGRDGRGREQWARLDDSPITPEQIADEFGEEVRQATGFRDLELGRDPTSKADLLPANIGGRLAGQFGRISGKRNENGRKEPRGTEELLDEMGLDGRRLMAEGLGAHTAQFRMISRVAAMFLRVALSNYPALGGPLSDFYRPHQKGVVAAHSFPPLEVWQHLSASAIEGKLDDPGRLATSLLNYSVALLHDLIGAPRFRYGAEKVKAEREHGEGTEAFWAAFGKSIEKVIPPDLAANGFGANTSGPNVSLNAACAGFTYAVYLAQMMMIQGAGDVFSLRRDISPHMMLTGASDATFKTSAGPAVISGFGAEPPLSGTKIVNHMISLGQMDPLRDGETLEQRWRGFDPSEQRRLFDHHAAPLTNRSLGLPFAEGAGAVLWERLDRVLKNGHIPTSILAGAWIGGGEAGTGAVTGMSQGGVTTLLRALALARQEHGVTPDIFYPHATNTPLFNVAELEMMARATEGLGITGMRLSALIAAVGHTQGASSAVATVMAIRSLMAQKSPLMLKWRPEDIDPRFMKNPWVQKALDEGRFILEGGVFDGPIEAIGVAGYGFGATAGNLVLKHVPEYIDAAAEVLGEYEGVTDDDLARWKDRAEEIRARADEYEEKLRMGMMTLAQIPKIFGYQ